MAIAIILLTVLAVICGVGSLVCWIIVLVKIFRESVGLGILGIFCSLFAFIYGWVKVTEYRIKNVMVWWTVFVIAGIGIQVMWLLSRSEVTPSP